MLSDLHTNACLNNTKPNSSWNFDSSYSPAKQLLWCEAKTSITRLLQNGTVIREWNDPLSAIQWMHDSVIATGSGQHRWVGYFSYDLAKVFEPCCIRNRSHPELPLFVFTLHSSDGASSSGTDPFNISFRDVSTESNFSRRGFESAIARAIEYIRAGDVFQVNLSQRFTTGLRVSPVDLYNVLQERFPADYGACLCYKDFALLSNSPELFLRVFPGRRVVTRPIKGTRPRGEGMELDLYNSTKDQAELNMIIDLERNDLGRVCKTGTVKVTQSRTIETHPTVYHGVATIEGLLRDDITFVDLLRATFPGGSVTGAPKIRAMQIIDELEPVARGPYCGAIGYLAGDGTMEFNVAIRTMIIHHGLVHIPVGGGIVADSIPADEYEETVTKAAAMFAALSISAPISR